MALVRFVNCWPMSINSIRKLFRPVQRLELAHL
jgi:hypothetical protein